MASATGRQFHHGFRLTVLTIFGIVAWPIVSLMAQSDQTIPNAVRAVDPQQTSGTVGLTKPHRDVLTVPKTSADDLTQVPEVRLQALSEKEHEGIQEVTRETKHREALEKTKLFIARINRLNQAKIDGFLEVLRSERSDLRGLPFAMGDACRTKADRNRHFAAAARGVREISHGVTPAVFWGRYLEGCAYDAKRFSNLTRSQHEHIIVSRVNALMQVLAPESAEMRLGLVKYLATLTHAEASRALAKLALYSAEDEIRQAAISALKVRDRRDFTDVLIQGMRYPWPAVATRACEVLVKLNRKDLLPSFVDLLDDPDPRAPVARRTDSKHVQVVRELVRINHNRNCLLCHAPAATDDVPADALTAAIPLSDEPSEPSLPYSLRPRPLPEVSVRIDVTYLRQDFSIMQSIPNAEPGSGKQRFDYLVRTRELTDREAGALRARFDKTEPTQTSPYRRAAVAALRELTGEDAPPTAEAWRKKLDLTQMRHQRD